MRQTAAARTTSQGSLTSTVPGAVLVIVAVIATLLYQSASAPAPSFDQIPRNDQGRPATTADGAVTEDDGVLPNGVTVFDDEYPGIANLDPDLLLAMRGATKDAAERGIELHVNSGWRSTEYQDQLFRDAVSEYGSEEEAARWVATADTSAHVAGHAVDIGPSEAIAWLSRHGGKHGLCQVYANEPWHFELRSEAVDDGCPPLYADPTHDPRMQQ
jgi:hypothetical protein